MVIQDSYHFKFVSFSKSGFGKKKFPFRKQFIDNSLSSSTVPAVGTYLKGLVSIVVDPRSGGSYINLPPGSGSINTELRNESGSLVKKFK
jgi:hypothetical protein